MRADTPPVAPEEVSRLLCDLLMSLFPDSDSLRRFLLHTPGYADVANFVRLRESMATVCMETVELLQRRGLVEPSLFAWLVLAYPARASGIIEVATRTGIDAARTLGLALRQIPERPTGSPPKPPDPPRRRWLVLAALLSLGAGTAVGYGLWGAGTEPLPGPSHEALMRCEASYKLVVREVNDAERYLRPVEDGKVSLAAVQRIVNEMNTDCGGILNAAS